MKRIVKQSIVLVLVLVPFILMACACGTPPPAEGPTKWDSSNGQIEALVMSEKFVEKQLKAPASAEFPVITSEDVKVTHLGNGEFRVESYVDSQNGFGAMIRTHYTCKLQDNWNHTWTLVSLVFPERSSE